jgi:energy-converting hydrogenase Eha subunit A
VSYAGLADTVLAIHFGVVVFVVAGLVVIPVGNALRWQWVNSWSFRLSHAAAIVVITVQAWLGQHCPLTVLEAWLRAQAGEASHYEVSFVQFWLERLMYFQAPLWVFTVLYTVFGCVVALAWWRYPPQPRRATHGSD